jgi:hypothetical protein
VSNIRHEMAALFYIVGLPLLAFLGYWFGAESRPDFLDPRRKHGR